MSGRPPIIETPEEFERLVGEYAEHCRETGSPPTFSGMAFHLGFASRQSFYDYEKRNGFSYPAKRARLLIESAYEARLSGNSPTGAIFALKNHGWSDRLEHTGAQGGPVEVAVTRRIVGSGGED